MIQVLDKGFVELIDYMGDDKAVVDAARVSFNKDLNSITQKREEDLLGYLSENKHTSPFEHVVFKFHVKCPLFVARQWMRHRTWSYNEISRRYTSENIDFYIPTELRKQATSDRQASTDETIVSLKALFVDAPVEKVIGFICDNALENYYELINQGVAREQARMILPQNMYTRFYGTVDLHNLLHFIELRSSEHAQYEMRLYANALLELIKPVVPITASFVEV